MWQIKETSPVKELRYGHAAVGTAAAPLTVAGATLQRGLLLRTPGLDDLVPNTDIVYIGKAGVTAGTNSDTDGMPMPPGCVLEIPVEDPSLIYAISQSPGQDVCWMGV
jgi:hypothetical protein